jgi:HlyD family secretion protein
MKKRLIVVAGVLVLGAGGYVAYARFKTPPPSLQLVTATVSRGSVVQGIDATGRLQAVTTVQVGSQVSGTIKSLYADFNSQVRRGQVVAELEPSLFETQVEQAQAALVRIEADVERSRVQLDDARLKVTRARDLFAKRLLPQADLETAEANNRTAEAALKSAEAQLVQGRASLNQSKVNLSHTVIAAPIDGVVISRNVDVGQTVAASMQAPTLFEIANDLSQMQVNANIDEADIGQIRSGQPVTFEVDAYPGQRFTGTVSQVRLNPVIEQNVVSYVTVISVPNPDLRLRPGMTANVTVEVARADDTLRVPTSALRFSPTPELFATLGQTPPEPTKVTDTQPARVAEASAPASPTSGAPDSARQERGAGEERGRSGAFGGGEEGRGGNDEQREALRARLAQMSPEERQAFFARSGGARGGGRGGGGREGGGRGGFGRGDGQGTDERRGGQNARTERGATFDGSPRASESPRPQSGQLWTLVDGQLHAVTVRVGIAGGPNVAVAADTLQEGAVIATGVIETTAAAAPLGGGNPLLPQLGRGRGGFFGFGRGGGGRGDGGGGGGGGRGGGGRGQ